MKWAAILKFLKSKGYTGADTLDAVKSWLAAENYGSLEDSSGKPIDLDASYKAHTEVTTKALKIDGGGYDDDEDKAQRQKDAADAARWRSREAAEEVPAVHAKNGPGRSSGLSHARRMAKSLYAAKVKSGEAIYDNADDAELAGAVLRTCMFVHKGMRLPYAAAGDDEAIIKGNSPDLWHKVQSSLTNAVGGALVPMEFSQGLIWLTEKYGFARRLFRNEPMSGEEKTLRRQTALNTAYWTGETASLTASDATFDNPSLIARKLTCLSYFSNELMEDSAVSVADTVSKNFSEAINYKMDLAAWSGDGTSTYGNFTGLINHSGVSIPSGAYVTASGNLWSEITNADILKIMGLVENVDGGNLAFLCSRQFFVQVMLRLAQAQGGAVAGDLFNGNGPATLFAKPENGIIGMFQGYPVYGQQVASLAEANSQKCLFFGDFQAACAIGIRREVRVESSTEYAFNADEMTFRGTFRGGINIHGDGRGSTYGPITCLVTAGS